MGKEIDSPPMRAFEKVPANFESLEKRIKTRRITFKADKVSLE